jgi:D-arabinose 1-dehydrogenase-like Zn-dependent alcohol dehydrogenase
MQGMKTKFEVYRQGISPKMKKIRAWPLFGAGMENLGQDGQMIELPMPEYDSDELLVRHDACGLCFSDIKIIRLGQEHPRIYRDMQKEPVILGHEVVMTVVGVGEKLRDQYKKGDKFILQADIYVDGSNTSETRNRLC